LWTTGNESRLPAKVERRRFDLAVRNQRQTSGDCGWSRTLLGTELNDLSLIPGDNPRIGATRFEDWLSRSLTR
jgi:hypothetical protein